MSPALLKAFGGLLALALSAGAFFFWVEAHRPESMQPTEPPSGAVDAGAGNPIWAERYTGDMKNMFSLQNNIVQAIVVNLAVKIPSAERARVVQKGTGNLRAYDYFLKAGLK